MIRRSILAFAALVLVACAPETSADTGSVSSAETVANDGTVALPHIFNNGYYSDVNFCTLMAPHHQHAIDMAMIEVEHGRHPELVAMARMMIESQKAEIAELKDIKGGLTGDPSVPFKMNPHTMQNAGVPMPEELLKGHDVDSAFLDGMLPHHSGAIQMATVALRHSQNGRVVSMARRIIDAQAKEIGEMIAMRSEWYPGLTHGFPHDR